MFCCHHHLSTRQTACSSLRFPTKFRVVSLLPLSFILEIGAPHIPICYRNVGKRHFVSKRKTVRPRQRREKMLFAFKRLRNISLASLSAECQDSVCKQSVHVRVVTWRKLLSCCPRSLTPEVNPDIDTYSPGQWRSLRRRATPESYHPVITPRGIKRPTWPMGEHKRPRALVGFANTDKVFICWVVKILICLLFNNSCVALN